MLSTLFISLGMLAAPDLRDLDTLFIQDTFDVAFRAHDHALMESKSCLGSVCDRFSYYMDVEPVAETEVVIVARKLNGEIFSRDPLTQVQWDTSAHNRVRLKIESLKSFGFRVEVLSISPSSMSLMVNGKITSVETRVVNLFAKNAAGIKSTLILEVASGIGGLGQILKSSESKGFGTEFFEVQELSR